MRQSFRLCSRHCLKFCWTVFKILVAEPLQFRWQSIFMLRTKVGGCLRRQLSHRFPARLTWSTPPPRRRRCSRCCCCCARGWPPWRSSSGATWGSSGAARTTTRSSSGQQEIENVARYKRSRIIQRNLCHVHVRLTDFEKAKAEQEALVSEAAAAGVKLTLGAERGGGGVLQQHRQQQQQQQQQHRRLHRRFAVRRSNNSSCYSFRSSAATGGGGGGGGFRLF